jgi:drug/metabolite transporter (DMT)-like permease
MIALYFLPLSDLNAIKHTYMIWAAVLSICFLGDSFSFITACSVLLAMVGLTLTTQSDLFVGVLDRDVDSFVKKASDKVKDTSSFHHQ